MKRKVSGGPKVRGDGDRNWRPWGFDDFEAVRQLTDEALTVAIKQLGDIPERSRRSLRDSLQRVAVEAGSERTLAWLVSPANSSISNGDKKAPRLN
jgi:hypothetical protein